MFEVRGSVRGPPVGTGKRWTVPVSPTGGLSGVGVLRGDDDRPISKGNCGRVGVTC